MTDELKPWEWQCIDNRKRLTYWQRGDGATVTQTNVKGVMWWIAAGPGGERIMQSSTRHGTYALKIRTAKMAKKLIDQKWPVLRPVAAVTKLRVVNYSVTEERALARLDKAFG